MKTSRQCPEKAEGNDKKGQTKEQLFKPGFEPGVC